jgi:hypothetical protein
MKQEINTVEINAELLCSYLKKSLARDRELYDLMRETMTFNEKVQQDIEITHAENFLLKLEIMVKELD